jgi:hypothetical protein
MSENENYIGFIYRIDYIGDNPIIKNLSYAGSKKLSSKLKWNRYYGSPSKKDCIKCKEWKIESKLNPKNFKKEIISFVNEGESITKKEIEYMKSVSSNIIKDEKWLNSCIPRIGSFPECILSKEQIENKIKKAKETISSIKNKASRLKMISIKRKETCNSLYNVDHFNKTEEAKTKNSIHKKQYFSSMTEQERILHGIKSLKGRKKENVILGCLKSLKTRKEFDDNKKLQIEKNRKEKWYKSINNRSEEKKKEISEKYRHNSIFFQKQLYVTIMDIETGIVESDFIKNWILRGYARDGIRDRIKKNSKKILFSRKCKKNIIIVSHTFMSLDDLSRKS